MNFRTEVKPDRHNGLISHSTRIMTLGSCFADEVSSRLAENGFNILANPFGTLYNPLSISSSLRRILNRQPYADSDTVSRIENGNEIYSCLFGNSRFNSTDKSETLSLINQEIAASYQFLKDVDFLIITFGTAHFYTMKESGKTVANCHKQPADKFILERLTIGQIVTDYNNLISELRAFNPKIKLVFTVSPNRYKAYGLHGSQKDKAILLLAIEEICKNEDVYYFPSYEAVIDDLRDYRFYAEDMIHPSKVAVDYVYDLFADSFFSTETKKTAAECKALVSMAQHRPLTASSFERHKILFEEKCDDFLQKYPEMKEFVLSLKDKTSIGIN